MAIVNLTSLDWNVGERYSMVAHSFRVMSRARNIDEMVVGLMHEVYSGSDYARGLFHCDVEYDEAWCTALKLLTPRQKLIIESAYDEGGDEVLLEVNLPRNLSEEEKMVWRLEKTKWNRNYKRRLESIAVNEIARHVMMYDLEDKLFYLKNPGEHPAELGYPYFVLPWKEHYCVKVVKSRRSHCHLGLNVPKTDDEFLLKAASDEEKMNLIGKYNNALCFLQKYEAAEPERDQWSEEYRAEHTIKCKRWFDRWYTSEIMDEEREACDSTL